MVSQQLSCWAGRASSFGLELSAIRVEKERPEAVLLNTLTLVLIFTCASDARLDYLPQVNERREVDP